MIYTSAGTHPQLQGYQRHLYQGEYSPNTVKKYLRDIASFLQFANTAPLTKATTLAFKAQLSTQYAPSSVNSILAAVNGFLDWLQLPECKVKQLKIQRAIFTQPEKELSRQEYDRLISTAEARGDRRLSLVLQTICATGIRVSELQHITVTSLQTGRTTVNCKGKSRTIFLPKDLCKVLKIYCKERKLTTGSIFVTCHGKALDRSNIWRMMKGLCQEAGVAKSKVFPHNLRHLFARTYYKIEKDISRLADILGHSHIDTTRIYIMETGQKHARQLEKMHLLHRQI